MKPSKWNALTSILVARLCILFVLFGASVLCAQDPSAFSQNCARLNAPEVTVDLNEILSVRIPSTVGISVPDACRSVIDADIAKWVNEDESNATAVLNRVCSYRLGWVEKKPGTCQAGGPPPLCPVDHWINVGWIAARISMADQESPVRTARADQLVRDACQCKLQQLQTPADSQASVTSGPTTSNSTVANATTFTIPCTYGCPLGTSCHSGLCRPSTETEHLTSEAVGKTGEFAKDAGIDKAKEAVATAVTSAALSSDAFRRIGEALKLALELSESFTIKTSLAVIGGIFAPTMISTDRDLYDSEARVTAADLRQARALYQEMADFRGGKPARAPEVIHQDLEVLRKSMRSHLETLNVAYNAVISNNGLGKNECGEVFQWQQQQLNQQIANIIALPE